MSQRPVKPPQMNWINPYIVVRDVRRALEFYEKAFGFAILETQPDRQGRIVHAEMVYHNEVIMLEPEDGWLGGKPAASGRGSPVAFYIYVEDVDRLCVKAEAAGARVLDGPATQYWGERTCRLECPDGYQWIFSQMVGEFDSSQAP